MLDPRDSGCERMPVRRPLPHLYGAKKVWRIVTPTTVVCCSDVLCTVLVHWTGVRTTGCETMWADGPCPHCGQGHPVKLQHWLRVQDSAQRWRASLLEVTAKGLESEPRLEAEDACLAGLYLTVWRSPHELTGRQHVRVERRPRAGFLPPDDPILPELRKMWAAPLRNPPITEPRLMVRDSSELAGDGPIGDEEWRKNLGDAPF